MNSRATALLVFVVGAAPAFAQYSNSPQYQPPSQQPYPAQPQYSGQYPQSQYPAQPQGQYQAQPQYQPQYPSQASIAPQVQGVSQLAQLVSPIALYPDPLLAAMLPASTHPDQIAAAANMISANSDPALVDQQPWDDSVKAMAHYPAVITWMAQNPDWTAQLGNAVATQQGDVLSAIQQLRANAQASGLLENTPQQQVVVSNNIISIEPAQPNTVYVPYYDPQYIETRSAAPGAGLSFGIGYALGSWNDYDLDWRSRSVWIDHDRDDQRHGWQRLFSFHDNRRQWRPTEVPRVTNNYRVYNNTQVRVARPTPFAEHASRWNQTRTPGLQPTGRTYNNRGQRRTCDRDHDDDDRRDRDER